MADEEKATGLSQELCERFVKETGMDGMVMVGVKRKKEGEKEGRVFHVGVVTMFVESDVIPGLACLIGKLARATRIPPALVAEAVQREVSLQIASEFVEEIRKLRGEKKDPLDLGLIKNP